MVIDVFKSSILNECYLKAHDWFSVNSPQCNGTQFMEFDTNFKLSKIPLRDDNYERTTWIRFSNYLVFVFNVKSMFPFSILPKKHAQKGLQLAQQIQVIAETVYLHLLCGEHSIKNTASSNWQLVCYDKGNDGARGKERTFWLIFAFRICLSVQDVCFLKSICTCNNGVKILCSIQINIFLTFFTLLRPFVSRSHISYHTTEMEKHKKKRSSTCRSLNETTKTSKQTTNQRNKA